MSTSNRPNPRTRLSRERVLRAAVRLADEHGLDALSMRRLAKDLRVEAMSLYNHVENKDEILAGMVEQVAGEIELPTDPDWKAAVKRNAISSRDVMVRHRWASTLFMSRQGGGAAQLRQADWMLRTLREAGLSKKLIYHAFHVLEAYVLGYTTMQRSFPYTGDELAGRARGFLEQLSPDEFPDLVEHVHQHLEPRDGDEDGFEVGLELLLDGLERLRDAT